MTGEIWSKFVLAFFIHIRRREIVSMALEMVAVVQKIV